MVKQLLKRKEKISYNIHSDGHIFSSLFILDFFSIGSFM